MAKTKTQIYQELKKVKKTIPTDPVVIFKKLLQWYFVYNPSGSEVPVYESLPSSGAKKTMLKNFTFINTDALEYEDGGDIKNVKIISDGYINDSDYDSKLIWVE